MLIVAEPARDAVGHAVPTWVSVDKNVVTLTVDHAGGSYVYPVIAGTAFEVGYIQLTFTLPPPPGEPGGGEGSPPLSPISIKTSIGSPQPIGGQPKSEDDGATASSGCYIGKFKVRWSTELNDAAHTFGQGFEGHHFYNGCAAWWRENEWHPMCDPIYTLPNISLNLEYCEWIGPNHQPYGSGRHISAQIKASDTKHVPVVDVSQTYYHAATMYGYGSGHIGIHDTKNICNPLSTCPG